MGESAKEIRKGRRWKASGKGRGLRWLILRELVGMCALKRWTTTELEDAALIGRGLSHRKTYEMVMELERARCLEATQLTQGQYWKATEHGVHLFLGRIDLIPATIAGAVLTIRDVFDSEDIKKSKER